MKTNKNIRTANQDSKSEHSESHDLIFHLIGWESFVYQLKSIDKQNCRNPGLLLLDIQSQFSLWENAKITATPNLWFTTFSGVVLMDGYLIFCKESTSLLVCCSKFITLQIHSHQFDLRIIIFHKNGHFSNTDLNKSDFLFIWNIQKDLQSLKF